MSTQTFSDRETGALKSLLKITDELRKLEKDMPMSMVAVFTWVALNEGKTQVEMRNALDIPSASSSRIIAALSKWHRLGKEGHDLVEFIDNPEDRRAKLLFLTTKGKALASRLIADF